MSSGNAFARPAEGAGIPSVDNGEDEASPRPRKRVRISEAPVAAFQIQSAQEETALEVDIMILDYLTYQVIQGCLGHGDGVASPGAIEHALASLDTFLAHFKAQHASHQADAELRFRISLARFVALYMQRMSWGPASPSEERLHSMRAANRDRVESWIGEQSRIPSFGFHTQPFDDELPVLSEQREQHRAKAMRDLGADFAEEGAQEPYYGASDSVSLLDLLPLFMQVSAEGRAMTACDLNRRWIELACELMLQACLEQYLMFGASGTDAIDEAFAWGYTAAPAPGGVAQDAMSAMCRGLFGNDGAQGGEVQGWSNARRRYLARLFPPERGLDGVDSSLALHLASVAAAQPMSDSHAALVTFLEALSMSIDEPVLAQLEAGRLVDMTEAETRRFLKTCGLAGSGKRFFDRPVGYKDN